MYCGRCCVTEPCLRAALRLDIFIEILPGTWVNRGYSLPTGANRPSNIPLRNGEKGTGLLTEPRPRLRVLPYTPAAFFAPSRRLRSSSLKLSLTPPWYPSHPSLPG